ncbi:hemolysin family protein [Candidatus Poribacteria bacterium]
MDTVSVFLHLIGLAFLLSLSAFFSGSETALFSLSKAQVERLRQGAAKGGMIAAGLLDTPRKLLITILVGNMFVNVASASLVASFAAVLLGNKGVGVAIIVTTILLLIFGEITPKTIAVHNAERISKLVAYPIQFFSTLIFPLRVTLRFVTNSLIRLVGSDAIPVEDRLTTEELRVMVEIAEEDGSIRKQEKEMLNTIFDLRNITAAEIMTPRTEIICISEDSTLQQVFDLARTAGRSRIPVYKDGVDHISGIAHVRDFPMWRHHDICDLTIEEFLQESQELWPNGKDTLIRPPLLIPETRTAMGLLQDFHDREIQMAILLDEYGGTAGLVTMEDLIEELVGEIDGEYDAASGDFRSLDAATTLVSGGASIRNVNRKLGLNLLVEEDEDIDTIGGYVLHLFGRIPESGDVFRTDDLEFEVAAADKQRVTQILIKKLDIND